jgi:hypothetical protein
MSINEYSLKIKGIVKSLASINVFVDDDDLVNVCLNGLGKEYKPFKTSITVRENVPNFRDLVSILIVEEKTLNEDCSTQNKNNVKQQAFYSNTGRSKGKGRSQGQGGGRLGIKILDRNNQVTYSNNSHTEVVEEASLKARGAKEDVAIITYNNLDQILETIIIVANQAIRPKNVERRKVT